MLAVRSAATAAQLSSQAAANAIRHRKEVAGANVSWDGSTLVEGVEHVEGFRERIRCLSHVKLITKRYRMLMHLVTPFKFLFGKLLIIPLLFDQT